MPFNNADTLRRFLKGEYKARGKKIEVLTDFKWRVVEPTQEALAAVPCKVKWPAVDEGLAGAGAGCIGRVWLAGGAGGAAVVTVGLMIPLPYFQVIPPMAAANRASLGQVVE